MEIAAMINELKTAAAETEKETSALENLVVDLRTKLNAAEEELRAHTDSLAAMKMAIESLEIIGRPINAPSVPVVQQECAPKRRHHTSPKEIVKLNASGKQICVYRSISQCAKALGWSFPGTKKYIENIHPEKQVRLKGFILKYAE